jgi:hypothetical protein
MKYFFFIVDRLWKFGMVLFTFQLSDRIAIVGKDSDNPASNLA